MLQALLGSDINSFLSVPIPNPSEKTKRRRTSSFFKEDSSLQNGSCGDAEYGKRKEQEPVLLVCLVNKKTGDTFDKDDEKVVKECFQ